MLCNREVTKEEEWRSQLDGWIVGSMHGGKETHKTLLPSPDSESESRELIRFIYGMARVRKV